MRSVFVAQDIVIAFIGVFSKKKVMSESEEDEQQQVIVGKNLTVI